MRTIKTYSKRAPFYNALIRRRLILFAAVLTLQGDNDPSPPHRMIYQIVRAGDVH